MKVIKAEEEFLEFGIGDRHIPISFFEDPILPGVTFTFSDGKTTVIFCC